MDLREENLKADTHNASEDHIEDISSTTSDITTSGTIPVAPPPTQPQSCLSTHSIDETNTCTIVLVDRPRVYSWDSSNPPLYLMHFPDTCTPTIAQISRQILDCGVGTPEQVAMRGHDWKFAVYGTCRLMDVVAGALQTPGPWATPLHASNDVNLAFIFKYLKTHTTLNPSEMVVVMELAKSRLCN